MVVLGGIVYKVDLFRMAKEVGHDGAALDLRELRCLVHQTDCSLNVLRIFDVELAAVPNIARALPT